MELLKKIWHRCWGRPEADATDAVAVGIDCRENAAKMHEMAARGTVGARGEGARWRSDGHDGGGERPEADATDAVAVGIDCRENAAKMHEMAARGSVGARREVAPLRIEGIAPAPLTGEADEAEVAAEALLHTLSPLSRKGESRAKAREAAPKGSKGYYEQLAERIREGHEQERRAAMRYVAWCEQTLSPLLRNGESRAKARDAGAVEGNAGANNTSGARLSPSTGEREEGLGGLEGSELAVLERGLFKHQDAVEREGGELLRRWQRCLADVTVRMMAEL